MRRTMRVSWILIPGILIRPTVTGLTSRSNTGKSTCTLRRSASTPASRPVTATNVRRRAGRFSKPLFRPRSLSRLTQTSTRRKVPNFSYGGRLECGQIRDAEEGVVIFAEADTLALELAGNEGMAVQIVGGLER